LLERIAGDWRLAVDIKSKLFAPWAKNDLLEMSAVAEEDRVLEGRRCRVASAQFLLRGGISKSLCLDALASVSLVCIP
jgi:hypothetical protein